MKQLWRNLKRLLGLYRNRRRNSRIPLLARSMAYFNGPPKHWPRSER